MDFERMERTMQFILEQQADAAIRRAEAEVRMEKIEKSMQAMFDRQADADERAERLERSMQIILDQQAETNVKLHKINEQLAVLTADVATWSAETDKLHEDIVLLSNVVRNHQDQIQLLTALIGKLTERVSQLAEIVRLTRNNGHNREV